jgi:hypothetical protein
MNNLKYQGIIPDHMGMASAALVNGDCNIIPRHGRCEAIYIAGPVPIDLPNK